jgi:hypothetical protein
VGGVRSVLDIEAGVSQSSQGYLGDLQAVGTERKASNGDAG